MPDNGHWNLRFPVLRDGSRRTCGWHVSETGQEQIPLLFPVAERHVAVLFRLQTLRIVLRRSVKAL
jgi:hypothetical protein